MASNSFQEPPSFISEEKPMAEYEEDVLMWSRLTTLKPELHAEAIVILANKSIQRENCDGDRKQYQG